MHFLYIISALIVSIGVNIFAGADSDRHVIAISDKNRAAVEEQRAQILTRALRREVRLNPSRFTDIRNADIIQIPDDVVDRLGFGGYRSEGRQKFYLTNTGEIVARIVKSARYGANSLNDRADIVNDRIQNPGEGREIGRLDLSDLGL